MPNNNSDTSELSDISEEIRNIINRYHQAGLFNGSAAVFFKGQTLLNGGFGCADLSTETPVTPQTRFFIGSNSKQFTTALIFILADKGILDLGKYVTDYLPYFRKDTGRKITLHHLLTHTSGVSNYTDHPDFQSNECFSGYTIPELIQEISRPELEFEPGSRFQYSNSNYFVLGGIIEHALGQPFYSVLKEYITIPLGLSDTGYYKGDEDMGLFAKAYYLVDKGSEETRLGANGFEELPLHRPELYFSAGNIYSSLADMTRWIGMLTAQEVIPERYRDLAFKTMHNNYACGVACVEASLTEIGSLMKEQLQFVSKSVWKGEKVYRFFLHRGVAGGYSSFWMAAPELDLTIVLLNSVSSYLYLDEIIYYLAKALFRLEIRGGKLC